MSIGMKQTGEFLVDLSVPGTQSATTNKRTFVVPFACQLKSLYATLGAAGTTGNQDVSVNKNGTIITSSTGGVRFATGVTAPNAITFTSDPPQFAKGDVITVDVAVIHTTPAVNLNLLLVLQRKRGVKLSGAVVTGGIGPEAE